MNHQLICADARTLPLPDQSIHLCITSPPYYDQRVYTDLPAEIGLKRRGVTGYIDDLCAVFKEVHRVLRDDGNLVLNMGDTYHKKQLLGLPWRLVEALRSDGSWILRSDGIWHKTNAFPDSAQDRPENSHEYLFLLTKSRKNYWDKYAVSRRERLSVRSSPVARSKLAHFASYPVDLIAPFVRMGSSDHGCCPHCGRPWTRRVEKIRVPTRPGRNVTADATGKAKRDPYRHVTKVRTLGWDLDCHCQSEFPHAAPCRLLDPFAGTCTTALAAEGCGRDSVMVDLAPEFLQMGRVRLRVARGAAGQHDPLPGQMDFPVLFDTPATETMSSV